MILIADRIDFGNVPQKSLTPTCKWLIASAKHNMELIAAIIVNRTVSAVREAGQI